MKKWFVISFVFGLLISGCNREKTACFGYRSTPIEGWEQHNVLTFKVDTIKQSGEYGVYVSLRTTNAYPFQSIFLLVKTQLVSPEWNNQDTLVCVLTDKQGIHSGHGISFYQNDYLLKKIKLQRGQSGNIMVSHIMRRNILPGISDVGVTVKKE
ncbi:MAG: gliding motility lipoprotein GldH [Bacteroidaceae bacterium]|jgi:gliding motility-associated lipoprotein GldH|nr:gliding motility lipoprotein GldH [Bacteroidaceae bacterium]